MIPCFSVDDKLGDWVKCRSLFRNLYELDIGVYLIMIMGIGGLTVVRVAFQAFGDYRALEDRVDHHRHWICRINGLCSD